MSQNVHNARQKCVIKDWIEVVWRHKSMTWLWGVWIILQLLCRIILQNKLCWVNYIFVTAVWRLDHLLVITTLTCNSSQTTKVSHFKAQFKACKGAKCTYRPHFFSNDYSSISNKRQHLLFIDLYLYASDVCISYLHASDALQRQYSMTSRGLVFCY